MGTGGRDDDSGPPGTEAADGAEDSHGVDGDALIDRWMAHHEEERPTADGDAFGDERLPPFAAYLEPPPLPPAASAERPARTPPAAYPPPGVPADVDFPPRRGTRRVLALALLLMLAATALAAWSAQQDPDAESVTLAATLAVLTLVTWAVRAGSALTTLSVRGGQLQVRTGGRRTTFDLTSGYTPIEVIGRPGRRGWKVVFGRGTMRPFTVDAGLVDPHEFMAVLRRYRPE